MLAPITPHIAHYLWRELKFGDDVMRASWPDPDPAALQQDETEYVVQVNGKTRGKVSVPAGSNDEQTASIAITAMSKYIGDKQIRRKIVVPGKLINLVIG